MAQEDKEKVLAAFGGHKGLLDAGAPSIVFLVAFNLDHKLNRAIIAAVISAAFLAVIRLLRRDTLRHVASGFFGVLICALFAAKSGNAVNFYLPKLITNLAYGSGYLLANLIGWPLIGVMLGPILGENFEWRKDPVRKKAYIRASWIWVALFFGRIAVQYPLYRAGKVNILGTVNLAMGYPLFLAAAWGTWLVIKSAPKLKID